MYQNNEIDFMRYPAPAELLIAQAEFPEQIYSSVGDFRTYYLFFDVSKPPFDQIEVRQAFSHAIDRDAIEQQILGPAGMPAYSWLAPGSRPRMARRSTFRTSIPPRPRSSCRRASPIRRRSRRRSCKSASRNRSRVRWRRRVRRCCVRTSASRSRCRTSIRFVHGCPDGETDGAAVRLCLVRHGFRRSIQHALGLALRRPLPGKRGIRSLVKDAASFIGDPQSGRGCSRTRSAFWSRTFRRSSSTTTPRPVDQTVGQGAGWSRMRTASPASTGRATRRCARCRPSSTLA